MGSLNTPITIYHGDHQINSRYAFINSLKLASEKNNSVSRLDGKKSSPEQVAQVLEGTSLFGTDKLVALEGFITRLKSKDKTAIENSIVNSTTPVVLWESKKLTAGQLKPYKGAKVNEFKIPPTIFNFLDSLGLGFSRSLTALHSAIQTDSAGGVFYMLCRHIRLLIQASDQNSTLPPWQKTKLIVQLKQFSLAKILAMHNKLTLLDYCQKTGRSALDLETELELLIGRLYH